MGLREIFRAGPDHNNKHTSDIESNNSEQFVDFKDLEPKEKAVMLLRAVTRNIESITRNREVLLTEYLPKLSGFTKTLGGEFDPNKVDAAYFFDELLREWQERYQLLQQVTARINSEEQKATIAKNEIKIIKQTQITLRDEKSRREAEIEAGLLHKVTKERDEKRNPVEERTFMGRVAHGLGQGAMHRLDADVDENSRRCNEIRDILLPNLLVDLDEKAQKLDEVRMAKNGLSKDLDLLKVSFDILYQKQVEMMARFDQEIKGFHGMISRTNNGMIRPTSVSQGDNIRLLGQSPSHYEITQGVVTSDVRFSSEETQVNGSFIDMPTIRPYEEVRE